jgi:hypothetical protein
LVVVLFFLVDLRGFAADGEGAVASSATWAVAMAGTSMADTTGVGAATAVVVSDTEDVCTVGGSTAATSVICTVCTALAGANDPIDAECAIETVGLPLGNAAYAMSAAAIPKAKRMVSNGS